MFATHQPIIQAWAHDRPENFRDILKFVILSIRYPLILAAEDMSQGDTRAVAGRKLQSWYWIEAEYKRLWRTCEALRHGFHDPRDSEAWMLEYLASEVPGLGFAKAGFVMQLAYGETDCIDTHNITRFGLPARAFANVTQMRTRRRRMANARKYADLCRELGGCAFLWDSWCHYVAGRDSRYENAYDVSLCHLKAFNLA